jgi:hypothetical protein
LLPSLIVAFSPLCVWATEAPTGVKVRWHDCAKIVVPSILEAKVEFGATKEELRARFSAKNGVTGQREFLPLFPMEKDAEPGFVGMVNQEMGCGWFADFGEASDITTTSLELTMSHDRFCRYAVSFPAEEAAKVQSVLASALGAPKERSTVPVQNTYGAKVDSVTVIWVLSDIGIVLTSHVSISEGNFVVANMRMCPGKPSENKSPF